MIYYYFPPRRSQEQSSPSAPTPTAVERTVARAFGNHLRSSMVRGATAQGGLAWMWTAVKTAGSSLWGLISMGFYATMIMVMGAGLINRFLGDGGRREVAAA